MVPDKEEVMYAGRYIINSGWCGSTAMGDHRPPAFSHYVTFSYMGRSLESNHWISWIVTFTMAAPIAGFFPVVGSPLKAVVGLLEILKAAKCKLLVSILRPFFSLQKGTKKYCSEYPESQREACRPYLHDSIHKWPSYSGTPWQLCLQLVSPLVVTMKPKSIERDFDNIGKLMGRASFTIF